MPTPTSLPAPRPLHARRAPSPLAARIGRPALALCVAASITACTSWHRVDVATGAAIGPTWDHVRVTRPDGQQLELWTARLVRDTLYGLAYPRWGQAVPPTVAVPADSIRNLETRGIHRGRTTGLAAGVAGVGLAAVGVVIGIGLLVLSQLQ